MFITIDLLYSAYVYKQSGKGWSYISLTQNKSP